MGVVPTITYSTYPKQGKLLGVSLTICFHYDTSKVIKGVCIRDDIEAPYVTIFKLEDERVILATECQYHPD